MTPTNSLFKRMPMLGERTVFTKLKTPVNTAKTVASTWFGVIFAKRTRVGSCVKPSNKVSVKADVKSIYVTSSTPSH